MSEGIKSDEFQRWMGVLREDIQGVHERLDGLNGRTRANEQAIAVLASQSATAKDPAARWTGMGAAIGSALAAALAWFK